MLQRKNNLFDYCNILFMTLLCITIVFPFWDMIVRSLSDPMDANALKILLWPESPTLSAYHYLLQDDGIVKAYGVTIARTVSGTLLSLVMVMLGAYPLSKKELPWRGILTTYFLIPMFFGGGLIPSYLINKALGLQDNFLVYILPGAVGIYNVILARNYLMSIDKGLEESALIDGAGYITILTRILVPLSTPILSTLALWVAVGHWNAWFDSLIYMRDEDLIVVQLILRRMNNISSEANAEMANYMLNDKTAKITSTSVRMATTVVTMVPIMCVYPFIQKYFVKGIMVGSLKG